MFEKHESSDFFYYFLFVWEVRKEKKGSGEMVVKLMLGT